MITLENYGWNPFHDSYHQENSKPELSTGRIISIKGFKYAIAGTTGEVEGELSGRLLFAASSEELPKVGDWVFYIDYTTMGYIVDVFPRMNSLARKNPGTKVEQQILATNIDMALIVQSLDQNFNLMRLERYLVQLAACEISTAIVLNKSDLVDDVDGYEREVMKLGRDTPLVICSTVNNTGLEQFSELMHLGKTYVLIGSSGVGKSSIVNHLMKDFTQKISSTSESNQKGRHTTTARELFKLSNGSLLIDTPGMREFGVTGTDDGDSSGLFPMIEKFAASCKFSDCRHINEVGCAVIDAATTGALDATVYESYLKLLKEQRRFEISAEEKRRFGKQSGKISREANDYRKKYKF